MQEDGEGEGEKEFPHAADAVFVREEFELVLEPRVCELEGVEARVFRGEVGPACFLFDAFDVLLGLLGGEGFAKKGLDDLRGGGKGGGGWGCLVLIILNIW